MIDIILISSSSPIILGIYKNLHLHSFIKIHAKTSDALPLLFSMMLNRKKIDIEYKINDRNSLSLDNFFTLCNDFDFRKLKRIFYCRGAGSLGAIKLSHVFLQGLSLSLNIRLHATNCFYFTKSRELFAFKQMSFFLEECEKSDIILQNRFYNIVLKKSSDVSHILDLEHSKDLTLHDFAMPNITNNIYDLFLPEILNEDDFSEPLHPIYVTPFV